MRKIKRLSGLILALVMSISLLPATAFAHDEAISGNTVNKIYYTDFKYPKAGEESSYYQMETYYGDEMMVSNFGAYWYEDGVFVGHNGDFSFKAGKAYTFAQHYAIAIDYELAPDFEVIVDGQPIQARLSKDSENTVFYIEFDRLPGGNPEDYVYVSPENLPDPYTAPYTDVPEDAWYKDAVYYAKNNGLMVGYSAGLFHPEKSATRSMIISVLHRIEKRPEVYEPNPFTDVDNASWYSTPFIWAHREGFFSGYGNGIARPEDDITVEQLLSIVMRYLEYKGYDVSSDGDLSVFYEGEVSKWAESAVSWGLENGLISVSGAGAVMPKDIASRGYMAWVLRILCEDIIDWGGFTKEDVYYVQ